MIACAVLWFVLHLAIGLIHFALVMAPGLSPPFVSISVLVRIELGS
jgi:hypothetical protein